MKASKQSKEVVKINFTPQKEEKKEVKDQANASKESKMKSKLNQWKLEQNQNNVSVVVKKG